MSGPRSPGADATVSPIRRRCHAPADPRSAIEWHIVGPGPLEDLVRTRFAAAGLQHRLVMHGFRPKSDVARLIRQSHFLVLPSHAENCPLAICEALSIGRPVVASDVAGCRALVGDDDGILARAGDADSLKDAVIRLLSNYAAWDWQAIAQRARARFSGEAVASCYAGIFRHVGTPASNVG